jgi:hypothetical protein
MRRFIVVVGCVVIAACRSKAQAPAPVASATPSAPPVDRLAPGELTAGLLQAFGLSVPRGMQLDGVFPAAAHMSGNVSPDALALYVRDRVVVANVQMAEGRTIFPNARIKAGDPKRVYDIEIIPSPGVTRLIVNDVTRAPTPAGLSEADIWRANGYAPDGTRLKSVPLE